MNQPDPAPASWEECGSGGQRLLAIHDAKKNYLVLTEYPMLTPISKSMCVFPLISMGLSLSLTGRRVEKHESYICVCMSMHIYYI